MNDAIIDNVIHSDLLPGSVVQHLLVLDPHIFARDIGYPLQDLHCALISVLQVGLVGRMMILGRDSLRAFLARFEIVRRFRQGHDELLDVVPVPSVEALLLGDVLNGVRRPYEGVGG